MNLRPWNISKTTLLLALFAATSLAPISASAAGFLPNRPVNWGTRTISGDVLKTKFTSTHSGSRFRNVTFQNYEGTLGVIEFDGANDITFTDCKFRNFKSNKKGQDLVAIGGRKSRNIRFINCRFEKIAGDCIQMGNNRRVNDNAYWTIRGCTFKSPFVGVSTGSQASENAIDIKSSNHVTVEECSISGYRNSRGGQFNGADGARGEAIVCHQGAHNVIIRRCKIFNCVTGIAVVPTSRSTGDLIVSGITIENNFITRNKSRGIVITAATRANVVYNTLVNNTTGNLSRNNHPAQSDILSSNNLIAGTGGKSTIFPGGWSNKYYQNVSAVKFRGSTDFHIQSNSPARNAVRRKSTPYSNDIDKQSRPSNFRQRDLGADEYR